MVGYRCPPKHTQFKPGQSGNKGGRPKGSKNRGSRKKGEERLKDILLHEAFNDVSVKENGREITLEMATAVIKSILANAVKGRIGAQRLAMELIASIEAERKREHENYLESIIDYKIGWQKVFAEYDKNDDERPEVVIDPAHIVLDFANGDAWIDGPVTSEQRDAVKKVKSLISNHEDNIADALKVAAEDPSLIEMTTKDIELFEAQIKKLKKMLPSWSEKIN